MQGGDGVVLDDRIGAGDVLRCLGKLRTHAHDDLLIAGLGYLLLMLHGHGGDEGVEGLVEGSAHVRRIADEGIDVLRVLGSQSIETGRIVEERGVLLRPLLVHLAKVDAGLHALQRTAGLLGTHGHPRILRGLDLAGVHQFLVGLAALVDEVDALLDVLGVLLLLQRCRQLGCRERQVLEGIRELESEVDRLLVIQFHRRGHRSNIGADGGCGNAEIGSLLCHVYLARKYGGGWTVVELAAAPTSGLARPPSVP